MIIWLTFLTQIVFTYDRLFFLWYLATEIPSLGWLCEEHCVLNNLVSLSIKFSWCGSFKVVAALLTKLQRTKNGENRTSWVYILALLIHYDGRLLGNLVKIGFTPTEMSKADTSGSSSNTKSDSSSSFFASLSVRFGNFGNLDLRAVSTFFEKLYLSSSLLHYLLGRLSIGDALILFLYFGQNWMKYVLTSK